jgi:1-deoxy-D-xylulose-5-phosphate synthase
VVFCIDRAGLVGEDGPTHHGVFDLTFLRAVPGLVVMAPSNEAELADMLHTALAMDGPVVIRYPRGAGRGVALPAERRMLTPGVSETVRQGEDVALLAIGRMVETAERAAESLATHGVEAEVVDMRWVKPLDRDAVRRAADRPLIVTLEENTGEGGFGGAVMETLAEEAITVPVMKIAIPDCFVTHGKTSILLEEVGLTPESVTDAILRRLAALREAEGAIVDDGAQARRRAR